ncbi:unnamed protein product [Haemonchus placei]|uniref:Transposase n=1 Tax=Haemonchus placei TaxID=6290 RepID=A0A0N4WAZ5_HAEPC|nr:unnamed protein product [Haemonchus placei]
MRIEEVRRQASQSPLLGYSRRLVEEGRKSNDIILRKAMQFEHRRADSAMS